MHGFPAKISNDFFEGIRKVSHDFLNCTSNLKGDCRAPRNGATPAPSAPTNGATLAPTNGATPGDTGATYFRVVV